MYIQDTEEWIQKSRPHKELVELYILTLDRKDGTVKSYAGNLRRYLRYLEENHIEKPTDVDVIQFKRKMKEKNPDGGATVQKYVVVLRQFYKWCKRKGYYPNIAEDLTGEKITPTYKRDYLRKDQMKEVLNKAVRRRHKNIIALRDCAIIHLLLYTGMRTIEASRADKEDLVRKDGVVYLYIRGKGRDEKDEAVVVSTTPLTYLKEYLEARNDEYEPLFIDHGNNRKGGRLSTKTISKSIKTLLGLVGIADKTLTAHSLRHTFATLAMASGVPIEKIRISLRHQNASTTERYLHYLNRENNDTEFIVAEAIESKKKK